MDQVLDNRYAIEQKIGSGAMSDVFLATDTLTWKKVAVKQLKSKSNETETESLARLRLESDIIATLSHPSVIKLYSILSIENNLYLIMEYFHGKNMKNLASVLSLSEKIHIIRICAEALAYIHKKGIIHRDIKPSNILINPDDIFDVRIIDFGLAYLSDLAKINNGRIIVGSFAYISPEQTGMLKRTIDARSDLYSLGVTFFELLTGKPPFVDKDVGKLIHKHLALKPVPPSEFAFDVPGVVDEIVLKLLHKEPGDRYQTAEALKEDLQFYLDNPEKKGFSIGQTDNFARLNFQIKIIGRDNEITKAKSVYDRVVKGGPALLLIKGKSGAGKSKFVEAIKETFMLEQNLFLGTKCTTASTYVPYGPLHDIIEQYFNSSHVQQGAPALQKAIGRDLFLIQEIFAEFTVLVENGHRLQADEMKTIPENEKKQRIFNGLAGFFTTISSFDKTIVLFIDDIQWADNNTLEFIEYLAENLSERRLLVILSVREEEQDEEYMRRLAHDPEKTSTIDIVPLTPEDIPAFLSRITGQQFDFDEGLYQWLYHNSFGFPYHLLEAIAFLRNNDILFYHNNAWRVDSARLRKTSFNSDIAKLLIDRLSKYDSDAIEILSFATIIGKEFDLVLLNELIYSFKKEKNFEKLISIIDKAIDEQLLKEDITRGKGRYHFSHDKILETLYGAIDEEKKKKLHRFCAETLERLSQQMISQEIFSIAYHYNRTDITGKIIEYCKLAYEKAMLSYSVADAIHYLLKLCDTYIENREINRETIVYFLDVLHYLNISARYDDCFRYANLVEQTAEKNQWDTELLKINLEKGLAYYYKNDIPNALESFTKMFSIAEKIGEEIHMPEPYLQFGGAYFFNSEFDKAEYHYDQAIKYLNDNQYDLLLQAHGFRSVSNVARGYFDKSRTDIEFVEATIHMITNPLSLIQMYHLLSIHYSWSMENIAKGIEYGKMEYELALKTDNVVFQYVALGSIEYAYFYAKEYKKTLEIFDQLIVLAEKTGTFIGIHYFWGYRAEALLYLSQFEKANNIAMKFLPERKKITNIHGVMSFLKCRAVFLYIKKMTQEALAILDEAHSLYLKQDVQIWGVFILLFKSFVLNRSGNERAAEQKDAELQKLVADNHGLVPHLEQAWDLIKIIEKELGGIEKKPGLLFSESSSESMLKEKIQINNIIKTSQLISSILDIDVLLAEIMEKTLEVTGAERGALLLYNEITKQMEYKIISNIDVKTEDFTVSTKIIKEVEMTQKGLVLTDISYDENFDSSMSIMAQDIKSIICAPLLIKDKSIGLLYLDSKLLNNLFSQGDLELLQVFASQAAIAIENAQLHVKMLGNAKFEQELHIATDIQTSIIPVLKDTNEYNISAFSRPTSEVGGDYYDLILDEEPFFGIFGDVSGHGIRSGLVMLMAEVAFNAHLINAADRKNDIKKIYQNINKTLYNNIQNRLAKKSFYKYHYTYMYMTSRIFRFDRRGNFEMYGNDHAMPIVCRYASGEIEIIPSTGFMLGIMPDALLKDNSLTFTLEKNDLLIFYSDGITEAMKTTFSDENELFDEERLYAIIKENRKKNPQEIIATIIDAVDKWMAEQKDDISMLIIQKR